MDNNMGNKLIKNVDQIVEKRRSVYLKLQFDQIWKSLFLVTFTLTAVNYWYFFNWHFKGEMCEITSQQHQNNRGHEFQDGRTKEFINQCLQSEHRNKEIKNFMPIELKSSQLNDLINQIDQNKSVVLFNPKQFDYLNTNQQKPDMQLLLDKSQQEQIQNLENLNIEIPVKLQAEQFSNLRKLINKNFNKFMTQIQDKKYLINYTDFYYLHEQNESESLSDESQLNSNPSLSSPNSTIDSSSTIDITDIKWSYEADIMFQLSNYQLSPNADYDIHSSEINLYSALVTINDLTNHSYAIKDISYSSQANKQYKVPHAKQQNPRSIQQDKCNKKLALRDHWVIYKSQCQVQCNQIMNKFNGMKSSSGNKAMCTVNDMTTDGEKDNPQTGFNCQSIDQIYDFKSYQSRYVAQFKEYQECNSIGNSISYDVYVSEMIKVSIAIFKQAYPHQVPNSADQFTNNLKLSNLLNEKVIKGVFNNNTEYLYKLNYTKNVIDYNLYKILQETKLKLDSFEFIGKQDCGFIKNQYEDFIGDMCGPNKAHNMIIQQLNQFILTVVVILSILVREAVRVWRTEDEIRLDEQDWDK